MEEVGNSLKRSREVFKKKDREVIAAHHGVSAEHPVVDTLLSTAVRYALDPLGGHLWIVDGDAERVARDGADPAADSDDLRVGITRDGLLVVARRDERYGGMQFDAVRSEDTFRVSQADDGAKIEHSYPDLSIEDEDLAYRGLLIGAYAKVFVRDQFPTYYFAWLSEHGQFDADAQLAGTWAIYQSAMIIKAAQSVTLRLAFGVTGVVGVDEIRRGDPAAEAPAEHEAPPDPTPFLLDLDLPTEVKDPLVDMVAAANEAESNSWSLAKLRMRLGSDDPAILQKNAEGVLEELETQAERRAPTTA